jgi:hypothetical protein
VKKKIISILIVVILLLITGSIAEAAELFSDSFELNNLNLWDGWYDSGAGAIVGTEDVHPYNGTYNLISQIDGSTADQQAGVYKYISAPSKTTYARGYFKFNVLPNIDCQFSIMSFESPGAYMAEAVLSTWSSGGTTIYFAYMKDGVAEYFWDIPVPLLNVWYCYEMYLNIGALDGAVKFFINGVEVASDSGFDNDDWGNPNQIQLARFTLGQTAHEMYADDILVYNNNANADTMIKGTGTTSAAAGLNVTNSSDTSLLYLRNDGKVGINNTNPGSTLDAKGTLRLSGATTGYVGLAPAAAAGNYTYTLPSSDGTSGQILSMDSSGTLSWVTPSNDLVVTHTAGNTAPVTKTVTYRTVTTDLSGASHIWITQNLGADNQAVSAVVATWDPAGWFWQFNRKQGYAPGPTPAWTITSIDENSNWTSGEDPCTLLLGTGWRLPTGTEWSNVITNGGWSTYDDIYNSPLRLHLSSFLNTADGSNGYLGVEGYWWSSTQTDNTTAQAMAHDWVYVVSVLTWPSKVYGFTVRCLK